MKKSITIAVSVLVIMVINLCLASCAGEQLNIEAPASSTFTSDVEGVEMTFVRLDATACQLGTGQSPAISDTVTSVTIPAEVSGLRVIHIADHAFAGCTMLKEVRCQAVNPISLSPSGFPQDMSEATLRVPRLTWEKYKASEWANSFSTIIELPFYTPEGVELKISVLSEEQKTFRVGDGISTAITDTTVSYLTLPAEVNGYKLTLIEDFAFEQLKNLKGCTLPATITHIGAGAFSYTGLKSIELPKSLVTIDEYAFMSCTNLTSVSIPDGTVELGRRAFCQSGLQEVALPGSLQSLGSGCFQGTQLRSVDIPQSIHALPNSAFEGCQSLNTITLPEGITSLGTMALSGCSKLKIVTLPSTLEGIGNACFQGTDISIIRCHVANPFPLKDQFLSSEGCMLIVPKGTLTKYREQDGWNVFKIIEEE